MKKYSMKRLTFVSCQVTNTRLMGVVGVVSLWKDMNGNTVHCLFHLDYEDYGIDGFYYLFNGSEHEINIQTKKMMGGLGGTFADVAYGEFCGLILEAYQINLERNEKIPEGARSWVERSQETGGLNKASKSKLYSKICESYDSDFQLINYGVMRLIGKDKNGFEFLMNGNIKYEDFVDQPSMLLNNGIQILSEKPEKTIYGVTSLIYMDDYYVIYHWIITINREENKPRQITNFELTDKMKISSFEAAFLLRRNEYIQVYEVLDEESLKDLFETYSNGIMINQHLNGDLFTVFQTHNNHVKDQNYYLNGDIYVVFYVSNLGELVVSSFNQSTFDEAVDLLDREENKRIVVKQNAYQMNQSVIYEYIHSDCDSFEEFIETYV